MSACRSFRKWAVETGQHERVLLFHKLAYECAENWPDKKTIATAGFTRDWRRYSSAVMRYSMEESQWAHTNEEKATTAKGK